MQRMKATWGNVLTVAKSVGMVSLIVYCFLAPFQVHLAWSGAYVVLNLLLFPLLAPIIQRVTRRWRPQPESRVTGDALATGVIVRSRVERRPWELLLAAGEDGLFFLPLLYVGITPLAVLVVSCIYGFIHYPLFPLWACLMKWAFFFVVGMVILPQGILTVAVGHVANNCLLFFLSPHVHRLLEALKKPHGVPTA